MIKWIKDNGQEIETNDRKETVDHCESIGWKRADDKQKRTRRTREQIEADKAADNG